MSARERILVEGDYTGDWSCGHWAADGEPAAADAVLYIRADLAMAAD